MPPQWEAHAPRKPTVHLGSYRRKFCFPVQVHSPEHSAVPEAFAAERIRSTFNYFPPGDEDQGDSRRGAGVVQPVQASKERKPATCWQQGSVSDGGGRDQNIRTQILIVHDVCFLLLLLLTRPLGSLFLAAPPLPSSHDLHDALTIRTTLYPS